MIQGKYSSSPYAITLKEHNAGVASTKEAGELQRIIALIANAAKQIREQVARGEMARIVDVEQEPWDCLAEYSNRALVEGLRGCELISVVATSDSETPTELSSSASAQYAVLFDPLDGAVNRNVNLSVGTIFSIVKKPSDADDTNWLLQPGRDLAAGGYVLYGSSTMLVYTTGERVDGFTYDPVQDDFLLSHQNIRMPWQGEYYSTNDGYRLNFPEGYQHYFSELRNGDTGIHYSCRYIGALVADFHRTLLTGGVFAYPPTTEFPGGKLKLLYEVNPIALLATTAGGVALDGLRNVLTIVPDQLDQRTTFVVGGGAEMESFVRHARNPDALVYRTRMRVR